MQERGGQCRSEALAVGGILWVGAREGTDGHRQDPEALETEAGKLGEVPAACSHLSITSSLFWVLSWNLRGQEAGTQVCLPHTLPTWDSPAVPVL